MERYSIAYTVVVDDDGFVINPEAGIQVVLHRTDILEAAVTAEHFTESDDDSEADEGELEAYRRYADYIVERIYDYMDLIYTLYPQFETDSELSDDE